MLFVACALAGARPARAADDGIWGPFIPSGLPTMMQAAVAADPAERRVYLFGPVTQEFQPNNNETYVLDLAASPPRFERLSTVGPQPPARWGGSFVFDPLRRRLLLIGGKPWASSSDGTDVWELTLDDPPRWRELQPLGPVPGPRLLAVAVYDSRRDRVILHGGARRENGLDFSLDDTWSLALSPELSWSSIAAAGSEPPALARAAAAYDSRRDRVLIFGGGDGSEARFPKRDLWSLSLGGIPTWSLEAVGGTPPNPRGFEGALGAAFDSTGDRLLVVGPNEAQVTSEPDTALGVTEIAFANGENWSAVHTAGADPGARMDAAIALLDRDLVVIGGLFDGPVPSFGPPPGLESDAHALDVDTDVWTDLEPIGASPPLLRPAHVALDSTGSRAFVLGGALAELWSLGLDSAAVWQRPFIPGVKPASVDMPIFWDAAGGRLLAVERGTPTVRVWELHLTFPPAWDILATANDGPSAPSASVLLDARRNRLLVFDGHQDPSDVSPLWQLRLGSTPAWDSLPSLRSAAVGAVLGWDQSTDLLVVHGGYFSVSRLGGPEWGTSTWTRPLTADDQPWTHLSTSGDVPSVPQPGEFVHDPVRDRLLYTTAGRVWTLATGPSPIWSELHPAIGGTDWCACGPALFDAARDRLLFPVNTQGDGPGAELRFGTPNTPELICPATGSWSAGSIREVSFGLVNRAGGELSFEYTLTCERAWPGFPIRGLVRSSGFTTDYVPIGIPVPDTAAFGSVRFDLAVTAREQAGLEDSCSFSLFGEAAPVVSLGAAAQPDHVVVRWQTTQPGLTVTVSRRSETGPWLALTRRSMSSPGVVSYEDQVVQTDQRYYYRAELTDPARAGAYGQVRVDVPQWALEFAADQQNPVRGRFTLLCAVASAGPIELDVFDLSGRRAFSATRTASGPGRLTFDLERTAHLSPGLYFARLRQGSQTRQRTIVFLR